MPNSGYFTNMKEVFDVLGNARQYNWLLSYHDCNHYPSEKISYDKDYVWLTGDEFVDIVTEYNIQFIWGTAAAYKKDITLDEVLQYPLPPDGKFADYCQLPVSMQNPLADTEIYFIDSTFLVITSKSKDVIERFATAYPDSEYLGE